MKDQIVKTYNNIQRDGEYSVEGEINSMFKKGYKVITMCIVNTQLIIVYQPIVDRNYSA